MVFIRSKDNNEPPLREYPKNRAVPPDVLADVKVEEELSPSPVDNKEDKRDS